MGLLLKWKAIRKYPMHVITIFPLFLDPCELQLQQDNTGNTTTSLIFSINGKYVLLSKCP